MRPLLAAALLAASASVALAQPAPSRLAIHNNSLMAINTFPNGTVQIVYSEPRPAMAGIGVQPGMQLVEGRWVAPNRFEGTAIVFAPRCASTFPYHVTGGIGAENALYLFGLAPVISPYCTVWGYAINGNSNLVFWPFAGE